MKCRKIEEFEVDDEAFIENVKVEVMEMFNVRAAEIREDIRHDWLKIKTELEKSIKAARKKWRIDK